MTHFEAYHWEDHVPRSGSWKFNLTVSLLAFGLIFAAFPDIPAGSSSMVARTARPAAEVTYRDTPVRDTSRHDLPAASVGALGQSVHCPIAAPEHADS
jgi:hypothetical protein